MKTSVKSFFPDLFCLRILWRQLSSYYILKYFHLLCWISRWQCIQAHETFRPPLRSRVVRWKHSETIDQHFDGMKSKYKFHNVLIKIPALGPCWHSRYIRTAVLFLNIFEVDCIGRGPKILTSDEIFFTAIPFDFFRACWHILWLGNFEWLHALIYCLSFNASVHNHSLTTFHGCGTKHAPTWLP